MGDNLVAIGRDRDQVAFADVYEYYAGRVKSFLMGKGMNEDTAEELTQEIMLTVWRRAESYDPAKAAASTWLFTIARGIDASTTCGAIHASKSSSTTTCSRATSLKTDSQERFVANEQASERLESSTRQASAGAASGHASVLFSWSVARRHSTMARFADRHRKIAHPPGDADRTLPHGTGTRPMTERSTQHRILPCGRVSANRQSFMTVSHHLFDETLQDHCAGNSWPGHGDSGAMSPEPMSALPRAGRRLRTAIGGQMVDACRTGAGDRHRGGRRACASVIVSQARLKSRASRKHH